MAAFDVRLDWTVCTVYYVSYHVVIIHVIVWNEVPESQGIQAAEIKIAHLKHQIEEYHY